MEQNNDEFDDILEEVDWDELAKDKDTYINEAKEAYQHPTKDYIITDWDEFKYDYEKTDWASVFGRFEPNDWICQDDEKRLYDGLQEEITVYRGGDNENGISWTLNELVAIYFAYKSDYYKGKNTKVFKKTIKKSDIRAILLDMDEDEIIVLSK